ncbi:unnamed protein product [Durusdinium trenchii]|uniref:Uncharacterized protein n=2 Tax=Durusdinium trenchii TaxID=1381693 RepID=A0ABP0IB52_9DINO
MDTVYFRKTKRRRVVESSSDGEAPEKVPEKVPEKNSENDPSTVQPTCSQEASIHTQDCKLFQLAPDPEDVHPNTSRPETVPGEQAPSLERPAGPERTVQATCAPKANIPSPDCKLFELAPKPEDVRRDTSKPEVVLSEQALSMERPAEPEPAGPSEPQARQALAADTEMPVNDKKRDHKVLHAARAWLKAPVRKADPAMAERYAALSGLTKKETSEFVEANLNRKAGQWCFRVVDERINARKREQASIIVTTAETFQPQPGESCSGPENAVEKESVVVHSDSSKPTPDFPLRLERPKSTCFTSSPEVPEAPGADAAEPSQSEVPQVPLVPRKGRGRGRGSRGPRKPKSPALQPAPAPAPDAFDVPDAPAAPFSELSCLDAPSPSGPARRRFAPLRPGTRKGQPTHWAPPAAVVDQQPQRGACRHSSVSKKGCAMVCDACGEELLYDGWKLEHMDELDIYNPMT